MAAEFTDAILSKCSTVGPEGLYTAAEDTSIQCAQNCMGW